jgi:cysteine desulfurase/selenocysteine lyase
MHALTPQSISEATAKLLAQLPGLTSVPAATRSAAEVPTVPVPGFVPLSATSPQAASIPNQPSGKSSPAIPQPAGTPSRPSGLPGISGLETVIAERLPAWGPGSSSHRLFSSPGMGTFSTDVPGISGSRFPSRTERYEALSSSVPIHAPGPSAGSSELPAGASSDHRLKEFVKNIQSGQVYSDPSLCDRNPELKRIRQSFGASSVRNSRPVIFDVQQIRRDFPVLHQKVNNHDLVWFDNAATTQKPIQVIEALSNFYSHDNSNIHRAAHTLAARSTDAYEGARRKVQDQVGASAIEEIIFVRGTTEGINLVANTLGKAVLQPGDEIVLSELEHHANIVPWQLVAKERGAVLKVIPVNDQGEVLLDQYQKQLGPRTRIVSLSHASNSLGTILPVAEMTHMARRVGAKVVIDGAQSISHMPINVNQIGCDFFVFSGHKIFGPTGIGAVFARREIQEILPPWQGGGNMIRNVTFEDTTYSDPPAKFEAGTPSIADAVGLGAALDYVNQVGLHNIGQYEHSLLQYATERLLPINGLRIIGTAREKVSVISFVLGDIPPEKVGQLLDKAGIAVRSGHHCAQPSLRRFGVEATVRPSFAFYNSVDEIDHLVDVVRRIRP